MTTGCESGRGCIHDHVRPWLKSPVLGGSGTSYRAFAPCHTDTSRSLSVSIGNTGRVIFDCFACTKRLGKEAAQEETRNALIQAGVPAHCLRRASDGAAKFEATVEGIVFGSASSHHKIVMLAAYLRGYGRDIPGVPELRVLAEDCGVSLAEAYRARGSHR